MFAVLSIAEREGKTAKAGRKTVVMGNNTASICALNRWRENVLDMNAAMKMGYEMYQQTRSMFWCVHVAGVENTEADRLSRSEAYVTTLVIRD